MNTPAQPHSPPHTRPVDVQPLLTRRRVLTAALASGGLLALQPTSVHASAAVVQAATVANITRLYTVQVARVERARTAADVQQALRSWSGQVAVGGGLYSMGGQVAVRGGLHLDLREMNRLVWLDVPRLRVRVQAGMRWRELQDHLDPVALAVKTMQSYANFTVGGSVSVNAHGRYVGHGGVAHSVRALQMVLADGSVVNCDRQQLPELFRAAIGGYGAVGLITEVELDVVPNVRIRRQVEHVALADYVDYFRQWVLADPRSVLHNASLVPPRFDEPLAVTWVQADSSEALTETARLTPRGASYPVEQSAIWAIAELPGADRAVPRVVQRVTNAGRAVKWLNHEASLDAASLEPRSRERSTFVLQEYFVPPAALVRFVSQMTAILRQHRVEAISVSIRHARPDTVSLLPWASGETFCLVLYFKQGTDNAAKAAVGAWTRQLIDAALSHGGRYYLPYQLHATRAQFDAAYPEAAQLRRVKQRFDSENRWSNELWRRYL